MDTMEHLFEELEVNGKGYSVEVTIAYDAGMVDNGIGPYEFWGARGTDVRMELEIDKWEIDSIDKIRMKIAMSCPRVLLPQKTFCIT